MSVIEFCEFMKEARKKERDERIFREWCALIPRLQDAKYLDFEYFKNLRTGANVDTRPADVIIAEIDKAHKKG